MTPDETITTVRLQGLKAFLDDQFPDDGRTVLSRQPKQLKRLLDKRCPLEDPYSWYVSWDDYWYRYTIVLTRGVDGIVEQIDTHALGNTRAVATIGKIP